MAAASFAVIEKYQALAAPPARTGGELKGIEAARAVRALNANATLIFYFAVDYARTWYDLGRWFDAHADLEVRGADGRRADDGRLDPGDLLREHRRRLARPRHLALDRVGRREHDDNLAADRVPAEALGEIGRRLEVDEGAAVVQLDPLYPARALREQLILDEFRLRFGGQAEREEFCHLQAGK